MLPPILTPIINTFCNTVKMLTVLGLNRHSFRKILTWGGKRYKWNTIIMNDIKLLIKVQTWLKLINFNAVISFKNYS